MKTRKEIDAAYTWNMEDMLPSDQAWEELFKKTETDLAQYQRFRGRLEVSPESLYDCLTFDSEMSRILELLFVHARQKSDEDTADPHYQEMVGRIETLSCQAAETSSFIVPELLSMDERILRNHFAEDSRLALFDLEVKRIMEKKKHTLDVEQEELLAGSKDATQSAAQIYHLFNNADLVFPEIQDDKGELVRITHGNFIPLMESRDRSVRRTAFEGVYASYRQFVNTLAATFSANVKQAVFYAKVRNYPSSRAYYLHENEIPEAVYDNLIRTVRGRIPLLHRYIGIRKKALGLEDMHMYDLYVPMVEQIQADIPYEKACEMVLKGLAPLGEEYGDLLREAFANRWIDVYESKGKRSGAYSWGAYGIHPYVLLNYNGTLNHVFTLAHEMGHAMHSYYSDKNQPYLYAGYTIFVAEVASTCNEALLIRHMMEESKEDPKGLAHLTNHFLDNFRSTLFRQTMFAEFEMKAHQKAEAGETLTAQALCSLYRELNEAYYGEDLVIDGEIDYEWCRIPHFYTPFYVYQYATGFSAAIAISSRILSGDSRALNGYLEFLKGGCSDTPIELLKRCGVDMASEVPVKEALDVFEGLLDSFEKLTGN